MWPEVGVGSIVKPYQKPHPSIVGTASDPDSKGLIALGKRGWGPVSSNLLHVNCLGNHWANYAKGAAEGGASGRPRRSGASAARSSSPTTSKVAKAYGGDDAKSPYRFYMSSSSMKLGAFKRLGRIQKPARHAGRKRNARLRGRNIL